MQKHHKDVLETMQHEVAAEIRCVRSGRSVAQHKETATITNTYQCNLCDSQGISLIGLYSY